MISIFKNVAMLLCWSIPTLGLPAALLSAGEVSVEKDTATGWDIYTLRQGETTVRLAPAAGANAFSVVHRGAEYFHVPDDLKKLPGVGYGNPILYPMPNRVRGATFTFEGQTYDFPKNGRGHFIHGLVHSEAFAVESYDADDAFAEVKCSLKFEPGGRAYERFPFPHLFRVTVSVRDGAVRWTYEVDNHEGKSNLPFGVGFHPYVIYQKLRKETYLQVPATHLMEATNQLPSGNLLELNGHPLDARKPRSMEGMRADDVFVGMTPDRPARVEFRDVNRSITFQASAEFTHLVVWTPDRPFFGIENQTCSTDAHNLASQGKGNVAHLQICPPGGKMTGTVEYQFK
jgi:aldose 1-epimerase